MKKKIKRKGPRRFLRNLRMRTSKFYVYIVECSDETYYTGYTSDLEKRIKLHNSGRGAKYTRARRPVNLVWYKEYKQFKRALKMEKTIKGLARLQKESLVKGRRLDKILKEAKKRERRRVES